MVTRHFITSQSSRRHVTVMLWFAGYESASSVF